MRLPLSLLLVVLLPTSLTTACSGTLGEPAEGLIAEPDSDVASTAGESFRSADETCAAVGLAAGPSALRRLTREQYRNAVLDLTGLDVTALVTGFNVDSNAGGFAANVHTYVDEPQVEAYVETALTIASRLSTQNFAPILTCDPTETSCIDTFIELFGRRVHRMPLSTSHRADYRSLFDAAHQSWNVDVALEQLVAALFSAPEFLYIVERDAGTAGPAPVAPFELATRLSLFLWNSVPDEALLNVAATGHLAEQSILAAEAKRMVADSRFARSVESFHAQWLEVDNFFVAHKDATLFPFYDDAHVASSRREILDFAAYVFEEKDASLEALLLDRTAFVDEAMASLYNVELQGDGTTLEQVELGAERAGLLTRAHFLASKAHDRTVSWVHRGLAVRSLLLCEHLPDPPPDISIDSEENGGRLENSQCATCHRYIDPIGQGFDTYDATGRYRTTDDEGFAVDTAGLVEAYQNTTTDIPFDDVVELSEALADSEAVSACIAETWARYALARNPTADDACTLARTREALEAQGSITDAIAAIVTTDGFLLKGGETP